MPVSNELALCWIHSFSKPGVHKCICNPKRLRVHVRLRAHRMSFGVEFHEAAINAHEQFPMKYLWFSKIWRRCCETPFDSFECQDNLCEAISKRFKNIPHNFGLTRMLLQNNCWWFEISKKLLGNNLHNCQFVYSWCLNFQKTKWCDENMQERCCEAIYKSFQWNINCVLKCERDLKARYPVKFASLRQTAAAYAALV